MDKLDREYVWECDYGNRKELKKFKKTIRGARFFIVANGCIMYK